ncbi:prepilin-type N-terminal cleavage/methylation domain-containing protein [Aquihabitans sp. G128]|uniref:type II secretion system protein n=1 Tax=Aquihabitans sp. G128 TaxID=2849779 RepID=UPI001C23B817|nr:prepilin-type N-terminal cleavage/methylation domain-containing protein [Aquihabitans sp. G128]QXC59562.1 prepilin-type N-terminal cleavage/methylation domain-containing protein [Aquihabitans sp. G128]
MLKHIKSQQDWNEKSLSAKGFTLIELLVVIVILGILAAVVVFAVNGITDKGKTNACKTEQSVVKTAVEAYNAQEGGYPTSISQLTTGKKYLQDSPTWWDITGSTGDLQRINTDPSQNNGINTTDCPA